MNFDMIEKVVLDTDISDLPEIFVPSYMRPKFATAECIFSTFSDEALKKVHIVVRNEQYEDYKEANPKLDIIPIPKSYPINGLASTRQFIFEYARDHGYKLIIDMDDDITGLTFCYRNPKKSDNSGSYVSPKKYLPEHPDLFMKILALGTNIAREAIRDNEKLYLGGLRRVRWSQSPENHLCKYVIDKITTSRQVTFINVEELARDNINRDMIFDKHGDDIGFTAVVLANGGHCFTVTSLCYTHVSEKCDSVIRTPETEKALHKYEYDMLQRYPIKDYLRVTFKDEEGNYKWGDVNWMKYHKLMGSKYKKCPWIEEEGVN